MLSARDVECIGLGKTREVRDQEADCTLLQDFSQEIKCLFEVGGAVLCFVGQDVADDVPDVRSSFFGRDVVLNGIGKDDEADAVVLANRGKR